jgi:hypothetical protein
LNQMQPPTDLLRRWKQLSISERRVLGEAWLLLGFTKAGLIALPFGALRGLLDRYAARAARGHASAEQTAWAVAAAARRLPGGASCLPQALAGHAMLHRRGYASRLEIGVATREGIGATRAHAWVEIDSRVIIGDLDDLARFAPLRPPA